MPWQAGGRHCAADEQPRWASLIAASRLRKVPAYVVVASPASRNSSRHPDAERRTRQVLPWSPMPTAVPS